MVIFYQKHGKVKRKAYSQHPTTMAEDTNISHGTTHEQSQDDSLICSGNEQEPLISSTIEGNDNTYFSIIIYNR